MVHQKLDDCEGFWGRKKGKTMRDDGYITVVVAGGSAMNTKQNTRYVKTMTVVPRKQIFLC